MPGILQAGRLLQHWQQNRNERRGLGRHPLSNEAAGLRGPGRTLQLLTSAHALEGTVGSQTFFLLT